MKKKGLTDAELQEIKNKVQTIIKKINEKVVVTGEPESEWEDDKFFVGFDIEGESVMLRVQSGSRRITLWYTREKWHPQWRPKQY